MIISTYITTRNPLFFQSTIEQTIRQATLFSDEIIISLSNKTTDDSLKLLNLLSNDYPNRIKIYIDEDINTSNNDQEILKNRKERSLKRCKGDYCILQDDDECIHEKYAQQIKQLPLQYSDAIAFRFNTIHFYRSYEHYQNNEGWYPRKIYMIKNLENIHHGRVETDPDNFIIQLPITHTIVPLDTFGKFSKQKIVDTDITVYHYGWVRNDSTLLIKKYLQEIRWWGKDYWNTHEFPLKFDNPMMLPEFKDTHPKYMIPLIEKQKVINTMHIKDFEKVDISDKDKSKSITYCMIGFNKLHEIKNYIHTILPYIDRFIYIDGGYDGGSTDGTSEYLKNINSNKIEVYVHEWKESFSNERNFYIQHFLEKQDKGWILVSDTDEHFPIETLSELRKQINISEIKHYNGIQFLAYDVIVDDNNPTIIINEHVSVTNFHKPLFFKYNKSIHYENDVHESLIGSINWKNSDLIYKHIRSQKKIYERATQNFWISSNYPTSKFINYRILCTKNNILTYNDFFKLYNEGKLPKEIENWLYDHKDYTENVECLEHTELRDTANYYFKLHNEKESKIITPTQAYNIAIETSKKFDNEWNNFIKLENKTNNITISACIITKNESETIKNTILSVYSYVDEIIINDASDDDKTKHECLHDDFKFKIKYFKTEKTNNFSEERNKTQKMSTCDYCLHIDTDEKFPIEFLENMRNMIQKHLDRKIIPLMFRFSRSNVELDINKDPDYQIRFVNTLYTKWERNIHEIPVAIKNDEYEFHKEKMKPYNLIPTDYVIEHLKKDRTLIRERWNTLSNISTSCVNKKILICSMFKNSSKWLDDILKCVDNFIEYNNKVSNNNKLLVNLAFLKSTVDIETNKILDKYIENINQKFPSINVWNHKFDSEADIPRYEKLAWLRNYLIEQSTQNIKLNDNDLILFMDSDVKFDKNIIHELILDMNNSNSDIIAPIICIDDYGVFKNNYFYDTLAFRNINNKNFSHFKPYVFGEINKKSISEIKIKRVRESLEQIQLLNNLRKINWEFNKNTPLNKTYPENLYKKAYELIDTNIPIEVNSVGSFYLMNYSVMKNTKYTGINDSEQVEFMNSAQSKGYRIFVSQRLKVLHINLEKYGLEWH